MHNKLNIFHITIPSYGMMMLIAIIVVTILGIIICCKEKLQIRIFLRLEITGAIIVIIGSKLWYTLLYLNTDTNSLIKNFMTSGYSSYGALLFGVFTMYILSKYKKINLSVYVEKLFFLIPLFHAFCKVGCFMAGCCYGICYKGPGAIIYPDGINALSGIPTFPVQLLEALLLLLLSIIFYIIKNIFDINVVQMTLIYAGCYIFTRFLTDFLRYKTDGCILTITQKFSIIFLFIIISYFFNISNQRRSLWTKRKQ